MTKNEKNKIIFYGFLGIVASIGVGVGEFLLHYSGNGIGYETSGFNFFNTIPISNLSLGHFIAIIFTPFYIAGYYHLYLIFHFKSPATAKSIFIVGIISFIIGGMWISSRENLGVLVHLINKNPTDTSLQILLENYKSHYEILVIFLRLWVALLSFLFVIPIIQGKTIYPKWVALLNPLFLLLLILLIYKTIPKIGYFIAPIAMNVVHFILFGTSLILLLKIKTTN